MVKLEEVTNEKYFPRGGGSDRPKPSKKPTNEASTGKKGLKRKAAPEEKEAKKTKEESSWIPKVEDDMFIEGLMGLGVVSEVFDNGVLLHTVAAQSVRIDVSEVSKRFTELINEEKIEMKDVFQLGQMVPFKVMGKKSKSEKGKTTATCNPEKINKHLSPNMLAAGLVIHTSVASLEEKGAVLDVGLDQMKGFIEKSQFPATGLREGQPLLARILSSTSRVVKVTSFVEQDNLSMASCEKLQLNHLMPGTILECEPTGDAVNSGIIVSIGNGLKGILPRRNLPPRLRENPEKLGKAIRAIVMFCQQNSKVLVLSAHPDIVAVTRLDKRTSFEGIAIGDKVKCTVIDVIVSKSIVYFTLPPIDGKKSLVTAVSSRGLLEKPDAVESEYEVGKEKLCRVTGYRYADRTVIVSTRKDIINQKITKYQDAKCGDILDARVRHVGKSGVHFSVCNFVNAFAPLSMLSDKPLPLQKLKAKFKVGTEMKCRVWQVCDERRNLIVSCREQLLALKGASVNSVEELEVGNTVPCLVRKVFPTGVLLLATYNNIAGVLRREYASLLPGTPKVNDYVEVNVEKIEENHRVVFVLRDTKAAAKTADGQSSEKKLVQKPKPSDSNIGVGKIYKGTLTAAKGEKANVTFTADNKKEVFASVDDHLLSDLLDAPVGLIKRLLVENKEQIERIVPMGKLAAINRACVKRSVARFVKDAKIPKKFEDLNEGKVVIGVVGQIITDIGVFVELVGGSGLVGKVLERKGSKSVSELLEVGQVIVGKVEKVDADKKNFTIDPCTEMTNGEQMLKQYALPLLESIVEEVKWLTEQSKLPAPGTKVEAKVTKELDDLTLVEFEHNGKKIAGVVPKSGGEESGEKKKKKKASKSLIIVDVNHATSEIVLAAPSTDSARIVAIRRDYLCAVSQDGLVYLPTRLHPNHLPLTDAKLKVHSIVDLDQQKSVGDGVFIAVRGGGDVDDVARSKLVAKEFTPQKSKKTAEGESVSVSSQKPVSIKNFGVYEGVVIGQVTARKDQKSNSLFAEIRLPGDNLGRLHVSELPPNLQNCEDPLAEFLKRNLHKKVIVRIIDFHKAGKGKVAELTMIPSKIQAGKVRASDLSYKTNYTVGDLIKCFGAAALTDNQELRVEVNPLWTGKISRENLSGDLKVKSAEGEIVDLSLKKGEMRNAKIVSVDKKSRSLNLSLDTANANKGFEVGASATGRIFFANKTSIRLKLSSGEQAVLTPTAISDKYESLDEIIEKQLKVGQLVDVVCARVQQSPKRFFVALKKRYSTTSDNEKRRLILDKSTITEGDQLDGIVENPSKKSLFVELGPGISGRIEVNEENEEALEIGSNSVVRVTVAKITEKEIILKLDDILIRKWTVKVDRKRKGEEAPTKVALLEEEKAKETVETEDPGFDWSNKGFRNEDLAAVGKLTSQQDEDTDDEVEDEEDVDDEEEEGSDEEEVDDEEDVEDEDGEDSEEEVELIEKTEEEHSRLVRSEPNSALNWIEYMSLFVEKSDLAAARKTAEEALGVINPTESEELLKMWTAYLNMEVAYGDATTVQKVFERACRNANAYTVHKTLAKIYQKFEKNSEATQILEQMVKKFRANQIEVWTLLAEHLMAQKDQKGARDLLPRALKSAPKAAQHIQLISKFAQLEFKSGDAERGRTLLEGLVTAHPKKTDLWLVYADAALKHLGIEHARKVLERACNLGLSIHKMRPLYKKWLEMESKHGDAAAVELVKSKAEKFLQSVADNVLEDED